MPASKSKPSAASPRPIAKPKAMSSKLLAMKFMQRSAAASTSKQDTLAVREAISQENAKRDAALQAHERSSQVASVEDAETRWELSYVKRINTSKSGSSMVVWGYGELMDDREENGEEEESEDEEEKEEAMGNGRMIFGKFTRKGEPPKPAGDQGSDSDSDSDSNNSSGTPSSSKKKAPGVSLRGLTSISNPGPQQAIVCRGCGETGHSQAKCPKAKCYACEGLGHMSRDCPRARRGKKREPMPFNSNTRDGMKKRRSGD